MRLIELKNNARIQGHLWEWYRTLVALRDYIDWKIQEKQEKKVEDAEEKLDEAFKTIEGRFLKPDGSEDLENNLDIEKELMETDRQLSTLIHDYGFIGLMDKKSLTLEEEIEHDFTGE